MRKLGWFGMLLVGCSFAPSGAATDGRGSDAATVDAAHVDATDGAKPVDAPVTPAQRKAITIVDSQVTGTLTDFPVWLDVTDAELTAARADGSDLYITDANDAALPYEITAWDATTGHLQAWFQAPALAHNVNTVFYLRFGGTTAAPAQQPAAVFSTYAAVWHFDDPLTGGTPTVADALGVTPGTAVSLGSNDQVAGKLGGGIQLDGSSSYVTFDNMVVGNTSSTISAWVSEGSANLFDTIVAVGSPSMNASRFLYAVYNGNDVGDGFYGNDVDDAGTNIQRAGFTLLHWTYDSGSRKGTLYRDGVAVGAAHTYTSGVATAGTNGWIGFADTGWGGSNYLNGTVDEVRIARSVLPPNWITTEFANQSTPASFYTVSAATPAP